VWKKSSTTTSGIAGRANSDQTGGVTSPSDRERDLRHLEALVAYPREDLEIELKGWIDLADDDHAANLMQAILALANHGGGYVLIGFLETAGTCEPDEQRRPADLRRYDQDRLNGIVTNYAEPVFHCELHRVAHPTTGAVHPVVVVPPGDVPIRARRDGPSHVREHAYYIRRPGPCSEPPRRGDEWTRLIRRCALNDRDRLLEEIRRLLGGSRSLTSAEPEPSAEALVDDWAAECLGRFEERIRELGLTALYQHGTATYSYLVQGARPMSQPEIVPLLEAVKGSETGWPMWLVLHHRDDGGPRPVSGDVESAIAYGSVFDDPSHADYWRVSPNGRFFLLRGFEEDGRENNREPGKVFDFLLPVWRSGEALLHASRTAAALADPDAPITFRAEWNGLQDRALVSLWGRRFMPGDRHAREDAVVSHIEVPADQIAANLAAVVQRLLSPLYAIFDLFEMPMQVIDDELEAMRTRRV
jgi:hypothetical protein